MSSLIPARWRRPSRHESDEQATTAPGDHRRSDRLSAPQGTLRWICLTPSGGKSDHDHEWQAVNRAAQSAGSVVYPCVVEIEESAS